MDASEHASVTSVPRDGSVAGSAPDPTNPSSTSTGRASGARHVFACLVHERPEVVADLVANLRTLAPDAVVLLYDGSARGRVLDDPRIPREPPVYVHPKPRPMQWGRLHDFAVDSMRFGLEHLDFEALTIVDSDQLLIRPGYVERVRAFLADHPDVGMLGNAPGPQPRTSRVDPVRVAWREPELWRPLLSRLPGGSAVFPHWTFWPSTVFTRRAAADLVRLFDEGDVERILRRSRIWATEEVVLPTLVAALGHGVGQHPASFAYVRYRVAYAAADVDRALALPDVYWIHPIPRILDHPLRSQVRRAVTTMSPSPGMSDRTPGPTIPAPAMLQADLRTVQGGLDSSSIELVSKFCRDLRSSPGLHRLIAPPAATRAGAAVREVLEAHGIHDEPLATDIGLRLADGAALDGAFLDDSGGFVRLVDSAGRAAQAIHPGGLIAVATMTLQPADAAAVVQTLATAWAGSVIEQTERLLTLRKPGAQHGISRPSLASFSICPHVEQALAIEGWLEADEAALLALAASAALEATCGKAIVELGSFCGRATVLLGGVAQAHSADARVHAIDRFDGMVGEAGGALFDCGPTLDRFRSAIGAASLEQTVTSVVVAPAEAVWASPISLLFVDALHDYESVSRDFRHFEPWLDPMALVAFHDYASYYPGVRRFVDELLASGSFVEVGRIGSLVVLRAAAAQHAVAPAVSPVMIEVPSKVVFTSTPVLSVVPAAQVPGDGGGSAVSPAYEPLVSCLMPTYNRRAYVPDAIARFLAQDYPHRELLVVDDGTDPVADLMPDDDRIRYLRIPHRLTIGAKRNLACEMAGGELLAHWDDDDWVSSWRLRYEVESLLASDADIVGLSTLLYYDPANGRAWRYRYRATNREWVHDPTFCYRRQVWQADHFPDTNYGLDTRYLLTGRRKRVSVLADHRFYVGMIHPGNTSRKDTRQASWTPVAVDEVRALMAADKRPDTVLEPAPQRVISLAV
jgi:predicted O-methyltransferase YrrM